jgi:hypothetical protein
MKTNENHENNGNSYWKKMAAEMAQETAGEMAVKMALPIGRV